MKIDITSWFARSNAAWFASPFTDTSSDGEHDGFEAALEYVRTLSAENPVTLVPERVLRDAYFDEVDATLNTLRALLVCDIAAAVVEFCECDSLAHYDHAASAGETRYRLDIDTEAARYHSVKRAVLSFGGVL